MLVSLKCNMMMIEDLKSDRRFMIIAELEKDSQLVIADASSEVPCFVHHIPISVFPTDSVIEQLIGQALGIENPVIKPIQKGIELDPLALSGLKKMPVDIFNNDYLDEVEEQALVLCVDIRNFSQFLRDNKDDSVFSLIKNFTSNFLSCVNQFGYGCSYYKLLGDGAIVIWDTTNSSSVREAITVFDTYIDFLEEELFKPYPEIGLAGALVSDIIYKYEISAEASQLKYRDYVGYGINLSYRLQGLAKKNQLVINRNLAYTGLLHFCTVPIEEYGTEIHQLKGLKAEDKQEVYLYQPVNTV